MVFAQSERILFVDDDDAIRKAFQRTLTTAGLGDVDLSSGYEQALALAQKRKYAVIAVDYNMPDMHGFDVVAKLKQLQPDATYLLVSGMCDLELTLRAVNEHGVSYVVQKPWSTEELVEICRRSLEAYWERASQRQMQRSMVHARRSVEAQRQELKAAQQDTQKQLVSMLLDALNLRGHETRAHCRRVASYAVTLAQAMGLKGAILNTVRQGGLLHDVGKIGVPDRILLKPGALKEDEWRIMRTHPELGARFLWGMDALKGAREVVAQHHEHWDGRGYPNGLAGNQICVAARIFAVADALDALTCWRPYRETGSMAFAIKEICRGAGTHFDPSVIEVFAAIPETTWLEIQKRFPDERLSHQANAAGNVPLTPQATEAHVIEPAFVTPHVRHVGE